MTKQFNGKIRISMEDVAAFAFFLICFFKSFWFIDIVNIVLKAIMFVGAILAILSSHPKKFHKLNKAEIIWVIALVVPVLGRLLCDYHGNDISETLGYTAFYLCATIYAISCANNKKLIYSSFKAIYFYLAILVFCTIAFKFTPSFYLSTIVGLFDRGFNLTRGYLGGNMSGLTSHYSTNGMYMALAVIIAVSIMISDKNRKNMLLVLITMVALLMTGKRGHLIFAVLALVIGYYFYNSDKRTGRIFKIIFIMTIFIFALYIVSLMYPSALSSINRIISKLDSDDVSAGRYVLWQKAFEYFKQYPIFGIGFKQFIRINGLDVHNIYIQFLCETGIIGTVIYISCLISTAFLSMFNLIKAIKGKLYKNKVFDRYALLFSFSYQIFFLAYGMTGNPFYDLPCLFPYFFCVGITCYYAHDIRLNQNVKREN